MLLGAAALALSSPAHASGLSCDEAMAMIEADLDAAMVVAAIQSSGTMPRATVTCLVERKAPAAVVMAAQGMVSEDEAPAPAPAPTPPPAESTDPAPPPPEAAEAEPTPAPSGPRPPLAPGYKTALKYTGGGVACFALAGIGKGIIRSGLEGGVSYSSAKSAALAHNVIVALGYAGVGAGAVIAIKTKKELTMSTQLLPQGGALSVGGVW